MKYVYVQPGDLICLGRCGENLARTINFDVKSWQEIYGEGTVQLLHQRPSDEAPYPCAITIEDDCAAWVLTAADTAVRGEGRAELIYLVNDQIVKSVIWATLIEEALGDASETAPDPAAAWVDKVLQAETNAADAAARAEAAAKKAEDVATGLASVDAQVTAARNAASDAAKSATAAGQSETNAAASATRAENAATKVEATLAELEAAMALI